MGDVISFRKGDSSLAELLREIADEAEAGEFEWLVLTGETRGMITSVITPSVQKDVFAALGAIEDLRYRVHQKIERD